MKACVMLALPGIPCLLSLRFGSFCFLGSLVDLFSFFSKNRKKGGNKGCNIV